MNSNFWSGKRVFVTGHTGFKGSWLCLWLQQMGAQITGYALAPPTTPNMFEMTNVAQGMNSVVGDVRDLSLLQTTLNETRAEVIFHLAAQPIVRQSYLDPVDTFSSNVMGTVNLLEAVRKTEGVRVVVNITSDKCYENREWVWGYRESDPMGGYDPYSSSKGCAELVTAAFRNSFFNPAEFSKHGVAVASARAGNVIGGGDWAADRLIPDIIRALAKRQAIRIRNPNAVRPWQHVLEPLAGYLMLAERLYLEGPQYGSAWNFGPRMQDAKPVSWIVEELTKRWGDGATWFLDDGHNPHEANYLKLDTSKSEAQLAWVQRWNLDQTLDRIVSWHKAEIQRQNLREITISQIKQYSNLN